MCRNIIYTVILLCSVSGFRAVAQESSGPADNREGGIVGYVNAVALEIRINRKLFKLDSRFRIYGLSGNDRIGKLRNLGPGMGVQYTVSGNTLGYDGIVRELWVQPD